VTDVFAEWMKMYAFAHGDISLVTIMFSFSPLWVVALTPLLTNDHLSPGGVAAVVVVVIGSTAAVYQPSHPDWAKQKKAIFLAIGASFFFGLNSIYDRLAVGENVPAASTGEALSSSAAYTSSTDFIVKPAMAGFTMTAVSACLLFPLVLTRKRLIGMYISRRSLSVRGLLEVAFMVSKLVAMKWLAAPYVVGLQRSSLVLSIIAGRVIFKEGDFVRRLVAGIIILAGVLWILWEQ
jgi:drug/metabolite transporter (DMT)-like permease